MQTEYWKDVREQLLDRLVMLIAVFSTIPVMMSVSRVFHFGWQPIFFIHLIILVLLYITALMRKRFGRKIKLFILFLVFYAAAVSGGIQWALSSSLVEFSVVVVLISGIFCSRKILVVNISLTVLMMAGLALSWTSGWITGIPELGLYQTKIGPWLTIITSYCFLSVIVSLIAIKVSALLVKHLEEKECLLRETHHRIKNHMMAMASLVKIQSRRIEDGEALDVLKDLQGKFSGMMHLYNRLFHESDMETLPAGPYLENLLKESVHINGGGVRAVVTAGSIQLKSRHAFLLGLIVNEMVTNAMKYAFHDVGDPMISLTIQQEAAFVQMVFRDNGIGFDPENSSEGFGLKLIHTLSEQLEAELDVRCENGAVFMIRFPVDR